MKYKLYAFAKPEEVVYTNGPIIVYHAKQLSRYYLTRDGLELGFKNACYVDEEQPDYEKWYASWEVRIRKRYAKIESQIEELRHERAELFDLISNQGKYNA